VRNGWRINLVWESEAEFVPKSKYSIYDNQDSHKIAKLDSAISNYCTASFRLSSLDHYFFFDFDFFAECFLHSGLCSFHA